MTATPPHAPPGIPGAGRAVPRTAVPIVPRTRAALLVIVVAAAVFTVLAVAFHGQDHGSAFDVSAARWINQHLPSALVRGGLSLASPYLTTTLIVLTAAACWLVSARRAAVFAAVAPLVCVVLTEFVLKPGIDRTNRLVTEGLGRAVTAYPSGHETGVASIMVVLIVLVLRSSQSVRLKAAVIVLASLQMLITGVALVGGYYHYATDIVGALCEVLVCVLGTGLLVDRYARRSRTLS